MIHNIMKIYDLQIYEMKKKNNTVYEYYLIKKSYTIKMRYDKCQTKRRMLLSKCVLHNIKEIKLPVILIKELKLNRYMYTE